MGKQQLLAFTVKAEGSRMDLDVYETIGESFWGDSISAKDVLAMVREHKPTEAYLRVNSGGGDLFDAMAISNLLKASGAKVHVSIDGVAASAATHVWPIGSHVTMASNAVLMIHKAWSMAMGNSTEMTKLADTLAKADVLQATNYEQHAASRGVLISSTRFAELMSDETWMTAEEALAHGLIDSIGEAVSVAASVNVTAFRRPPTALVGHVAAAKAFNVPTAAPAPGEHMDPKAMQAAIEAKDVELATIKSERDTLKTANETLTVEANALKTQNAAIAAERDRLSADIQARDEKLLDAEVDALIPNVLDPAERDNFIALAKTSRTLFDSMVAQRKPRSLTTNIVETDIPPAEGNAAVGADERFDALVAKDIT